MPIHSSRTPTTASTKHGAIFGRAQEARPRVLGRGPRRPSVGLLAPLPRSVAGRRPEHRTRAGPAPPFHRRTGGSSAIIGCVSTLPTRCDIEVREPDLPRVLALIRAQGLSAALGDAPPPDGHRAVAVWSAPHEQENQSHAASSLVEILARTLEDHALTYTLINVETDPSPASRGWWTVRFSDSGLPAGMRLRGRDSDEVDVQLEALSQFLGIDRAALAATADE